MGCRRKRKGNWDSSMPEPLGVVPTLPIEEAVAEAGIEN